MTTAQEQAIGIAVLFQSELTTNGTPRKRPYTHLSGLTPEQKTDRHRAQMREYHRRNKMSIDTANQIINDQEDAIAALKHDVLDREDQRDKLIDRVLAAKNAFRRIECAGDIETAHRIASGALVTI